MDAMTVILTSSPARFVPLVSAAGIGIAPAPVDPCRSVRGRRAADCGRARGEVVPFAALGTGTRPAR